MHAFAEVEAHRCAMRLGVTHLVQTSAKGMTVNGFLDKLGLVGGNLGEEELVRRAHDVFASMDVDG